MNVRPFLLVILLALLACKKEAPDATPADGAKALLACGAEADYKPGETAKPVAELDAYCRTSSCPWRKKVAEFCYFYGPRTEGHYHVYTTIPSGDVSTREEMCDTLRASRAFGTVSPIHVYCGDGKACSTCGGGGGHR